MARKISAVITTWNRASFLRRAIQSVLTQSFADFELLVFDNSSTDGTHDTVKSFTDQRVRYIKHAPMGISGARNAALHAAQGEFIAFLDDDDEWLPSKLGDQIAVFEKDRVGRVGFVYGAYVHIREETKKIFETVYPRLRGNVYEYAVRHRDTLTGSASNPLLRKSAVIDAGGYDPEVKTGEDYEMFLRLAKKYDFEYVNAPVVNIYVHRGRRLSHQLEAYLTTEFIVYRKHFDLIRRFPDTNALYLRVIAGKYLRLGMPDAARMYLWKAFREKPLNPGAWAQFFLSFFPKPIYVFFHQLAVAAYHRTGKFI